jgi:hypothetical protein
MAAEASAELPLGAPEGPGKLGRMRQGEYNDDWPTCDRTYAAMRIVADDLDPEAVTARLAVTPTEAFRKGEPFGSRGLLRRTGGWFLSTDGSVQSRDLRHHIDWLLDRIEPSASALRSLRADGDECDIPCYWLSASGHGGPQLDPSQMRRCAALDLTLWIDFYVGDRNGADT